MASYIEEDRFFLGEKSNSMVTVIPFIGKRKVHIRHFYVDRNGEIRPGMSGITPEIEEFYELVELISQVKRSIERYEREDTGYPSSPFKLDLPLLDLDTVFLPSPPSHKPIPVTRDEELLDTQPKFPLLLLSLPDVPPPLIEPSLEKILSGIRVGEQSNPTEMNFVNNGKGEMINDCDHKCPKAVGFRYPGVVPHCSECESEKKKRITLENMDDNSPKKEKGERKRSNEFPEMPTRKQRLNIKGPVESLWRILSYRLSLKKLPKRRESMMCIDEVASVEAMKEAEKKLWLEHYNQLCEKLLEVVREKFTGCQTDEAN